MINDGKNNHIKVSIDEKHDDESVFDIAGEGQGETSSSSDTFRLGCIRGSDWFCSIIKTKSTRAETGKIRRAEKAGDKREARKDTVR